MNKNTSSLITYLLRIADNNLILGHRVSEWCGHGPILEQDIALTNVALDLIGQSRNYYQYIAELAGEGKTEDDFAYLRDVYDFKNLLLVEQPNGHFGDTIVRQFLYDAFNYYFNQELKKSTDERIAAIAEKSLKEITYHLRFSSEWVIRLGDGTDESHQKIQTSVDDHWAFTGEFFEEDAIDKELIASGAGVNLQIVKSLWEQKVKDILQEATIKLPESGWMQTGGKHGKHSEHLGFILADLQFLQRAYPGAKW